MIVCRKCSRRHADGTDFCVCGAFLEFDGERVADDPTGPGQPLARPPTSAPPPVPPPSSAPTTRPAVPPAGGGWGSDPAAVSSPAAAPAPWSGFTVEPGAPETAGPGQVQAQLPDAPLATSSADVVDVRPTMRAGDVPCPRCTRPNPPTRQFCQHCGQELAGGGSSSSGSERAGAKGPSWWKRTTAKLRRRGIPTDPNRLAAEAHMLSRGGLSGRSMLFRSGGIALLLGGMLAFLGPWRGTVTAWARDQLGASRYELIDIEPEQIEAVAADPATEPVVFPMQDATAVVDRHLNTSWATHWLDPVGHGLDVVPDDDACQTTERTDSFLRISLAEPTDLARISIVPGRYAGDENRGTLFRPRVVELRWNGDGCRYLALADDGELSQHDFEHDDVEELEIRVVGVYADAESQPTVDIAEVVLESGR